MFKKFPSWLWLALLTLLLLVPFLNKPVNIDDTLFLWAAKQIQKQPWNFYGFSVNWYGVTLPMSEVTQNPPVASYLLALSGALSGWTELGLHLVMLLPAIAVVLGTYTLAKNYCSNATLAALIALLTPAFLISATTLMCDVLMLAFWIWAIVFWERGLQKNQFSSLALGAILAGLCGLTKFFGVTLLPLLTAYALLKKFGPPLEKYFSDLIKPQTANLGAPAVEKKEPARAPSPNKLDWLKWALAPLIPLAFMGGYQWLTQRLYDRGLLLNAAGYASTNGQLANGDYLSNAAFGVLFTGGCFLPMLLFAPRLWNKWVVLGGLCVVGIGGIFFLPQLTPLNHLLANETGGMNWSIALQATLLLIAGVSLIALTLAEIWERRDAVSALLVLWVLGTFAFSAIINWTINGRSLLPMAPALGILIVRRMERRIPSGAVTFSLVNAWPVVPAILLCWPLMRADFNRAETDRIAARQLYATYKKPGATLWFEGHWGFQYYMELLGAKALDLSASRVAPGDIIVVPSDESNVYELPLGLAKLLGINRYSAEGHLATMSRHAGAGFYAREWGPLPFILRAADAEQFFVFEVVRPRDLAAEPITHPEHFAGRVENPNPPLVTRADQMADWKKAITANPKDAAAHSELGHLLLMESNRIDAAAQFTEVLRLNPDDADAHLQLALLAKDNPTAAIEHYHAALRATPDSPEALNNLAWLLATETNLNLRNGPEAVQLARRACELTHNSSATVVGTLASAYAQAGSFDDAVETAKKAIRLARASGDTNLIATNRQLLELYRSHRAYGDGQK